MKDCFFELLLKDELHLALAVTYTDTVNDVSVRVTGL